MSSPGTGSLFTMDAVGPSPELRVALEPRAIARRLAIPGALAAVAAAALVIAGGPLQTFADALGRALDADPRWVVAAAAFELASFAGYIALLWLVAGRESRRMNLRASAEITLGGAGVTRLMPTAGVGGAALTLLALRRAGMSTEHAARTLFTFLVTLYSVFLAGIAISGGLLATGVVGSQGPASLAAVPGALAFAAILACLALGWRARHGGPSLKPGKVGALLSGGRLIGGGVRDGLVMLRRPDARVLGAIAWWTFDAAVLWAMLHAFGAPPSLAVVALAYFVGQAGNTLPIPGAVSGGIVGLLVAFGVGADVALVSVLAYRSVAIWLPAGIGLATLPSLRATLARWKDADAQIAEPDEAPHAPVVELVPPAARCVPARVPAREAVAA
jgi:putative heme transporter